MTTIIIGHKNKDKYYCAKCTDYSEALFDDDAEKRFIYFAEDWHTGWQADEKEPEPRTCDDCGGPIDLDTWKETFDYKKKKTKNEN